MWFALNVTRGTAREAAHRNFCAATSAAGGGDGDAADAGARALDALGFRDSLATLVAVAVFSSFSSPF